MIPRIITIFSLLFACCHGYKVLVYSSKFGFSHMNYIGSVADTLQNAGNNVTVLQPVLNREIRGTGCKTSRVITVEEDQNTLDVVETIKDPTMWKKIWTFDLKNPIGVVIHGPKLARVFDAGMKNVLSRKELMDDLRKEKFDVGIVEMFDYGAFPIMYELGVKLLIGVHSTVLQDRAAYAVGSPILPSYVPPMQSAAGDDGSFGTRLTNVIFTAFGWQFERFVENQAQRYMDEHHPGAPSVHETIGNMPFILTNSEPLLDFPRPKLYKILDIGGIGLNKAKKLDENWVKILSERKRNVLISFGSMAPSTEMPDEFREGILGVIKRFPEVTFVWKYEKPEDGFGKGVANLHLSKWTPQTDLLASGHIDLFMTHGGAGSVLEGAASGVPLVVVPLFGDQLRNALMAERFGFATVLSKFSLSSSDEVESAIRKGLDDETIRKQAKLAKDLLESRPFSPQELLVRHVDLAVKFGNLPSLAPSGRHFSFIQYHNLDILLMFATIALIVIVAFVFCVRKCCFNRKTDTKLKKQ